MYGKNTKNTLFKMICCVLLLAVLVPTNTALAATPSPVSALYAYGAIVDPVYSEEDEDIKLVTSSKSLWFYDGSSAVQIIKTHDNHGTIKHSGDRVQISV